MHQIIVNVPDDILAAEQVSETEFARELPLLAAIKLYELGRLSSGQAAELAGIGRIEFLDALSRYGIFPLEAELRDLESEDA
jgi:predicted HTH domain antitoxin